jgi:DNA-binding response OmpR family regulator
MSETMTSPVKVNNQEKINLPIFRTSKQGRVLLVEADPNIRQTLKALLNSQGYEVFVAEDIVKAYTMSGFRGYSFILFNQSMEDEAAGSLCKQIRIVNKATPLFFYSNQEHELESKIDLETNVQVYEAQSVTTNAMLKSIFLRLRQDRTKPSSAGEILNP